MAIKPGDQNKNTQKRAGQHDKSPAPAAKKANATVARTDKPTRNPMKSPLMQGAYDTSRGRTRKMTLPITKKVVELAMRSIDPDDTWVSAKINPRNQSLLSDKDPNVMTLRQSIKNETQREPVLVRQKPGPNGERYEIIYGSRRRFVAVLEKKSLGNFELLAEVADIGDPDAIRLARVENAERQDLSAYEQGCDLAIQKTTLYKEFDQKEMAAAIGLSEANLSKLLALSRIPENIIKLFSSPDAITIKDGAKILPLLAQLTALKTKAIVADISSANTRLSKVGQLVKIIEKSTADSQKITGKTVNISRDKPVIYGDGSGRIHAKLSAIRGKKDAYKIDVNGIGKDDLKRLDAFLDNLCQP